MFAAVGAFALYLAYKFVRTLFVTEEDVKTLTVDQLHDKLEKEIDKLKAAKKYSLIEPTVDDFNLQIFEINNKNRNKYEIDLHGLYANNSIKILKDRINLLVKERYEGFLIVIVGLGNHSTDGVAKIRPKVMDFLTSKNINFEEISRGGALRCVINRSTKYIN